jgi:hypothetical protein
VRTTCTVTSDDVSDVVGRQPGRVTVQVMA